MAALPHIIPNVMRNQEPTESENSTGSYFAKNEFAIVLQKFTNYLLTVVPLEGSIPAIITAKQRWSARSPPGWTLCAADGDGAREAARPGGSIRADE
ncbi:MAG: hypothetical protein WA211_15120 [Candidatus Acidiferrales bacterium]